MLLTLNSGLVICCMGRPALLQRRGILLTTGNVFFIPREDGNAVCSRLHINGTGRGEEEEEEEEDEDGAGIRRERERKRERKKKRERALKPGEKVGVECIKDRKVGTIGRDGKEAVHDQSQIDTILLFHLPLPIFFLGRVIFFNTLSLLLF